MTATMPQRPSRTRGERPDNPGLQQTYLLPQPVTTGLGGTDSR